MQQVSTIGISLDGCWHYCWAHLSPRVRVGLTSSPTHGIRISNRKRKGRRVALMSDILKIYEVLDSRELSIEILNHST